MLRPSIGADASSRFRHVGTLGAGSYGVVYEAIDTRSGQRVAIKELNQLDAASLSRFKQEFRALQNIHHPNLVALKELIEEEQRWLIVMELVEGQDFLKFVRPDGVGFDETRLRRALLGMATGLAALHEHGVLHRDLKPGNVRVTREGRAVLLDFGLAIDIAAQQPKSEPLVGTVAYMAPEQAARSSIGPAADFYAFGVCLFEALTGQWPFERVTAWELLKAKQAQPAPSPSAVAPRVPPDLDALCSALLERTPEQRPSPAEVLRVLGAEIDESFLPRPQLTSSLPAAPPFAGRDAELAQLSRALARTHDSELRIVLVEGESGVGKSELVAEFLRRAREERPNLLALHGRCYENEQVSYKAFDGCIDDLSRYLRSLPENECAALLPMRAAVLGQLFPVLSHVSAISRAPQANLSADPSARRLEAFDALAALLRKLAEEQPLVLVADDLQWADSESFRLLHAIVEHAEPPPILFITTLRPRSELTAEVLAQVEAVRRFQQTDIVQVVGLPPSQAELLTSKLLGPRVPREWLNMIARESEGHPLFLSELVQFARSHDFETRGSLTLEAALRARIDRLFERERALLEIVALAGRPHGPHIFARALSLPSVDEPARNLLATKLLRLRAGRELGCFHDRIRHAAVALISPSRLPGLHRRLAVALSDDPHADAAEQARHWDLAGQVERALLAYATAVNGALASLAFLRAAALCARAMELIDDERNPRFHEFGAKRAHALSCAGRNAEAAVLYQKAADRAEGEARLRLRSKAAAQLLLSSDVKQGFEAARALLREVGVRIPTSLMGNLLFLLWSRLLRGVMRYYVEPKKRTVDDPKRQLAYEILHQLWMPLSVLHPVASVHVTTHLARLAVKLGKRSGIAEAYATIASFDCFGGKLQRANPVFAKSRALCEELNDPVLSARTAYLEGSGRLSTFDFGEAIASLERAQSLLQRHSPDDPALLTNVRYHLGVAWYTIGAFSRLAQQSELWLAEARERGDRVAVSLLTGIGHGFFRLLMRDQPAAAHTELKAAVALVPDKPFSFAHFGFYIGTSMTLLYEGGPAALRWLDQLPEVRRRPVLMRTRMASRSLVVLTGLMSIAACDGAERAERAALLRRAGRAARALQRDGAPYALAFAHLMLAQIAAIEGDKTRAAEHAQISQEVAIRSETGILHTLSYLFGLLEGGAGSAQCKQVLEDLRAQGFRDPSRALLITLPALPLLAPVRRLPKPAGQTILFDRYEITGELGGGGFGTVMEVRDVHNDRRVALKELVSKAGRSLERFKQEFRALQGIHHDHVVRLDALFEHEGTWYIAMELVEGSDLGSYFAKASPSAARIRTVFLGLAQGLSALHAAGFVHRDVTPDNVRVTPEGRAVLLDFGLIARIGDANERGIAGSAEFAAPEQLAGTLPDPSADVYGLGSCLYRTLTGRAPFVGETPLHVTQEKRAGPPRPPPPSADPQLDALAALCMRMLAITPEERPDLAEVQAALSSTQLPRDRHHSLVPEQEQGAHFTGRERELAALDDAFERTADGLVMTFVEGESGLGKSALVAEFSQRVERRYPRSLVLHGRCYENEQVPLKAFDGAVDQLARALRTLPTTECEALLPKRASLLSQLFPVLSSVPAIAQASRKGLPADPSARRRAAIDAFTALLAKLSDQLEILLVIDDLQWADRESFQLLAKLGEQREQLPFLIVCTVRPKSELPDVVAEELAPLRAAEEAANVVLEGLGDEAVSKLAHALYGDALPAPLLAQLIQESKGHPLFLRELIEQEKSGLGRARPLSLDEALRARIGSFNAEARKLLSLVALADKPYGMHVLARAMHRSELSREALNALLGRGILRRRGDDEIACYHDRIRRVALAQLDPEQRRALARDLASALDSELRADPAERARLWDEAGDLEHAISAYERAGESALEALAFARTEQHYARALALLGEQRDERWHRILVQHGHALVRVGRSAEAARDFTTAALHAQGDAKIPLRILAAQQLIQAAQVEAGLSAAHALLAELDVAVPTSQGGAIARLVWDRSMLKLRGLAVSKQSKPLAAAMRTRLDVAWSLALPLAWVDPLASAALSTRHLRMALSSGELSHVARALAEEAFNRAVQDPNDAQIEKLLERARVIAAGRRDPALEAVIAFREGCTYSYRWDLEKASERLQHALQIVTERCPEEAFLRTNARTALGTVWTNNFEHARLARAVTGWIAEARDRSDQFALTMLTGLGFGVIPRLIRDQPDEARHEQIEQHARWPREPFSFAHLGELIGLSYTEFYCGGPAGLAWFDREMPRLNRSFLLKTALGRGMLLFFYGVAIVHAYVDASPSERVALRARLPAVYKELARLHSVFANNMGLCIEAYADIIDGNLDHALALARDVRVRSERIGHYITVYPVTYLEGVLEGGDAGKEKCQSSMARYTEQGWQKPIRAAGMFCPALYLLEQRART